MPPISSSPHIVLVSSYCPPLLILSSSPHIYLISSYCPHLLVPSSQAPSRREAQAAGQASSHPARPQACPGKATTNLPLLSNQIIFLQIPNVDDKLGLRPRKPPRRNLSISPVTFTRAFMNNKLPSLVHLQVRSQTWDSETGEGDSSSTCSRKAKVTKHWFLLLLSCFSGTQNRLLFQVRLKVFRRVGRLAQRETEEGKHQAARQEDSELRVRG